MAELKIVFTRNDNLDNFGAIFDEVALGEMTPLVEQGTGLVLNRAPVDRGFYRNSITNRVTQSPDVTEGLVYSTADPVVVNVIEDGRRPGRFPPVSIIEAWVGRKLRVPPTDRRSVAFLVARKIALQGIQGRSPFRKAFADLQPFIQQMNEDISRKVAARI